jgi:RHS repeat-associated protein
MGVGPLPWDAENRLIQLDSKSGFPSGSQRKLVFQYDDKGRRIRKTVYENGSSTPSLDLKFLYDGWNLLCELNATNNNLVRSYIWALDLSGSVQNAGGVGGLIAIKDASGIAHFAGYDGNGNVAMLVNGPSGGVSAQYEYDPFGRNTRATGPLASSSPFLFSTKFNDSQSGFCSFGHRIYSPSFGRWLSRDKVGEAGGLNIYGFCGNAPITTFDLNGLQCYIPPALVMEAINKMRPEEALVVVWINREDQSFNVPGLVLYLNLIDSKIKWVVLKGQMNSTKGAQPIECVQCRKVFYIEADAENKVQQAGLEWLGSGAGYVATRWPTWIRSKFDDAKQEDPTVPPKWRRVDSSKAWDQLNPIMLSHEIFHAFGVNHTSTHNYLMSGTRDWSWLASAPTVEAQSLRDLKRSMGIQQ